MTENENDQVEIFIQEWEYLRNYGKRIIEIIEEFDIWDYRVRMNEFTIKETFHHTVKAILEDAGRFMGENLQFTSSGKPIIDFNNSIDQMIRVIEDFSNKDLKKSYLFPWGVKTNLSTAIQQILFHSVAHFGQIRERVGLYQRHESK